MGLEIILFHRIAQENVIVVPGYQTWRHIDHNLNCLMSISRRVVQVKEGSSVLQATNALSKYFSLIYIFLNVLFCVLIICLKKIGYELDKKLY